MEEVDKDGEGEEGDGVSPIANDWHGNRNR
jgi:hypothetical protein